MEGKRINPYMPLLFAALVAAGFILGMTLDRYTGGFFPGINPRTDKVNEVIKYIDDNYVDTVNRSALEEKAIIGMLQQLDPHSAYIPASEFHAANDPLLGSFEGIGVQFQILEDTIMVVQTISGCPAEKVGVLPGDQFIYIDNDNFSSPILLIKSEKTLAGMAASPSWSILTPTQ